MAFVYRLVLLAVVLCGGMLLDEVPKDLRADAEWLLHWVGRHSTEVEEMLACAVMVCRALPAPAQLAFEYCHVLV